MTAPVRSVRRRGWDGSALLTHLAIGLFLVLVLGVIASVLTDSVARTWFNGGWLPDSATLRWYSSLGDEFDIIPLMRNTLVVALSVTAVSLSLGLPAAYVLARRQFWGKPVLTVLLLLPMMVPPITYGIPLATLLLQLHLAPGLLGVTIANVVPALPLAILVLTPFIEQIDPNLERAARMMGAPVGTIFRRLLLPLALPGLLAAGLLILVRTIALFDLTFLTSGPGSQTLVVALYVAVSAAGIRPQPSIDAMATVYMITNLVVLLAALRFVNPINMVMKT